MKDFGVNKLGFAGMLIFVCFADRAGAQPALPGQVGDWWARAPVIRSKYYTVKTDIAEEDAKALVQHIDATFESYMALFSKLPVRLRRPATLQLYLFATERDYMQVLAARFNDDGTGSWGKCISVGNSISLVAWKGRHTVEQMKAVLQHEGFHQVARHLFPGLPSWANEGLAEFFERGVVVGGKLALGEFPERDKRRLIEAVNQKSIVPLARFLAIDQAQWNAQVRLGNVTMNYVQAWSIVHFFILAENGKYEKNFMAFLVQLNQGTDWKVAFIGAFGTPDFQAMEQKWLAHVQGMPPTDYKETVRRLDFLAAGMAELRIQDVFPASLDELKAGLQKIRFTHTSDLFGQQRPMSAGDAEVFEIPHADANEQCRFVLVDSRGRIPSNYQLRRDPVPLNIATAGTDLYTLVVLWTKRGRDYEHTIAWDRPIAVAKVPARSRPADRKQSGQGVAGSSDDRQPSSKQPLSFRTWTSAGGAYSTEARLIAYVDGVAFLKNRDNKVIEVPHGKLSRADRQFLDAWKQRK